MVQIAAMGKRNAKKGDAAKQAKQKLISRLFEALRTAPTLGQVLRGTLMITIRYPGGRFRVYNYREALESVLLKVKRLQMAPSADNVYRKSLPPKSERLKDLKEAKKLARTHQEISNVKKRG